MCKQHWSLAVTFLRSGVSCWFICACLLLKNICTADIVYSQVKVEGVTGCSVLLPCESSKNEQNLQDINVLWIYNDSTNVLAIINGRTTVDYQLKYKNRTETFPEKYKDGNFTLKLNNLTHTDAGEYQCLISHSLEHVTVQLLVNESAEAKPPVEKGSRRTLIITAVCFSLFLVFVCILCIVCLVIARVKKSGSKASSSRKSATEACLSCPVSFEQISNPSELTSQNNQDYSELPANI